MIYARSLADVYTQAEIDSRTMASIHDYYLMQMIRDYAGPHKEALDVTSELNSLINKWKAEMRGMEVYCCGDETHFNHWLWMMAGSEHELDLRRKTRHETLRENAPIGELATRFAVLDG